MRKQLPIPVPQFSAFLSKGFRLLLPGNLSELNPALLGVTKLVDLIIYHIVSFYVMSKIRMKG